MTISPRGSQHWRIHSTTHNDVLVTEARSGNTLPPFGVAKRSIASCAFFCGLREWLYHAEQRLSTKSDLAQELVQKQRFEPAAASELRGLFAAPARTHPQRLYPTAVICCLSTCRAALQAIKGLTSLSNWSFILIGAGVLTGLGALALDVAWRQHTGWKPELHADSNVVVIQCKSLNEGLAPDFAEQLLSWVNGDNLLTLLRERLKASGFFGARFRECAGRVLLLLNKQRFNQRFATVDEPAGKRKETHEQN